MASWSAENATEAFLNTLKMGQKANEPDVGEFISAMAAGNNAQVMVVAYERSADDKILALAAAAGQTGGRVICIVPQHEDLHLSQAIFVGLVESNNQQHGIEFVVGEAEKLLETQYREADFVVIDCNLEGHEAILRAVKRNSQLAGGTVVVGFNALSKTCAGWFRVSRNSRTHLLPIGKGVVVTKVAAADGMSSRSGGITRKSQWVVKVDKCTGEQHVFRVRLPHRKVIIQA